ncbi:hypothetical protein JOC77_000688 [Peribacillus deserti]|uniref:Uncharacterized protein n=1 Tax=Peribacillus deserti TaxID=673318 RepID=A0ABS2QFI1_9BACI|nr:hypothetical protein [Peribacillus deserti]MBM7691283.1 hypothetical protein [Peribacillus deserti]
MSEYKEFLTEKEQIDDLIRSGYRIQSVIENLDGAFVNFTHKDQGHCKSLHIGTANARKYFSSILMQQNNG